jgi:NAD(P)-dependent dehydrogenase (short-subunit alcohol dehydrogenase family)
MPLLSGAVVLVTGANGGLGRELVEQALARGAAKVYATARRPQEWNDSRIVPLALDITNADSIRAAATQARDVTVLINNAGMSVESDTCWHSPTRRSVRSWRPTSSDRSP